METDTASAQGVGAFRSAQHDAAAGAAEQSTRPPSPGRFRGYAYVVVVASAAAATLGLTPGALPSTEAAYGPLGAALLMGALLTVRLRPGQPASSLLLVPAVVAHFRFGAAVLPMLPVAAGIAGLTRGVGALGVVVVVAHELLAFALGTFAAQALAWEPISTVVVFGVVFACTRVVLWNLARRAAAPPTREARAERPELVLSLSLIPLAGLPLLAWAQLGDGALLLALAALLTLLFIVREATNLATTRAEVEAERDRLVHANALQDELIQLITHEVKNPLTTVLAFSELGQQALREQNPERLTTHLRGIERGGRAIQRLVDNLLQLSRIEQSAELPPAEPIFLVDLAREVVDELRSLADTRGQAVVIDATDGLPPALAPSMLVREALSNLLSNAIKYTPEGGQVTVWARPGDEPSTVVLGVTDTGIGLSEEDLARLFTKFFRSADPRARQQRGSGLGLALTRSIIERLGGRIAVESNLNQGTTFRLVLPAAARERR